jgi:hypothetical protein
MATGVRQACLSVLGVGEGIGVALSVATPVKQKHSMDADVFPT